MKKLYDICVPVSSYTQNGQKRNRYENIGLVAEGKGGKPYGVLKSYINYAALPRIEGSAGILFYLFDVTASDNSSQDNTNTSKNSSTNRENWNPNNNSGLSDEGNPPF